VERIAGLALSPPHILKRMQPDSFLWKALEFYGTRVRHRGKWLVHHWLRVVLGASADCNLEVERQGLRWCLNPSDFVQTHLYWTGEYEPWDSRHLWQWAQRGAVVFDVGANFGYYSVTTASAMHGKGRVFAFEPCAATFARLRMNIALNHLEAVITPVPYGLSDTLGYAYLENDHSNSGAAAISSEAQGEKVGLDTLDHFCESNGLDRVDIVKMDVEGNELRVLEGGRNMLSRHMPFMMIEFNSSALEKAGSSAQQLSEMLRELGYQLLVARREILLPFQPAKQVQVPVNVFCVPQRRADVPEKTTELHV
jgi:FkbM family methyltransferase